MKVFISWSGPLSKEVALLLRSWIEDVLQGTETWISTDDIDKGSLWFGDIGEQLADTSVGILCLTRENVTAPWILFEAGALSKGLSKSRVCPFLVNLSQSDLRPPLSQFTHTLPTKEDVRKLVGTINRQNGKRALTEERVDKAFERWWDEFEIQFTSIIKDHKPTKEIHRRSLEDMVEEILQITRSLQISTQQEKDRFPLLHIAGHGGTGKSALVSRWLETFRESKPGRPWMLVLDSLDDSVKEEGKQPNRDEDSGEDDGS